MVIGPERKRKGEGRETELDDDGRMFYLSQYKHKDKIREKMFG